MRRPSLATFIALGMAVVCDRASLADAPVGRPVRVVSLCFEPQSKLRPILELVESEAAKGVDLISLPELCRGQDDESAEAIDGPTVTKLAELAKKYRTYVLVPIDEIQNQVRRNTAVLIGRDGKIQGSYEKVFPYWSEYDHDNPVVPGASVPIFETDFGKLGCAICYDVNFPEVWQALADGGAELVIWTSAYSSGKHVGAYALLHHYYIVTSTWTGDCQVYDITGRRILDKKETPFNVTHVTLDLDRAIFHENFNLDKRDLLLEKHAGEIAQEIYFPREQWFVLGAVRPGVSARETARQFGLVELRDYISRSRRDINKRRGHVFSPTASKER